MIATVLVAGCSFEHGRLPGEPDPDELGPDAAAPGARPCKVVDPDLRLCIELEDRVFMPTLSDTSMYGTDAMAAGVSEETRGGQPAAKISGGEVQVPEEPNLDISPALTIEMWINPTARFGHLIANHGQYGMALDDGKLTCWVGSFTGVVQLASAEVVPTGSWTHVACTVGGGLMRAWVNGATTSCRSVPGLIPRNLDWNTQLLFGYSGGFDDLRVYARALTAAEICARADKSGTCAAEICSPDVP